MQSLDSFIAVMGIEKRLFIFSNSFLFFHIHKDLVHSRPVKKTDHATALIISLGPSNVEVLAKGEENGKGIIPAFAEAKHDALVSKEIPTTLDSDDENN